MKAWIGALIALGASKVGLGISQGFAVGGSLSRTAASLEAGAKLQMVFIYDRVPYNIVYSYGYF